MIQNHHPIFRPKALLGRRLALQQSMVPWQASTRLFIGLWGILGVLIVAGVLTWTWTCRLLTRE